MLALRVHYDIYLSTLNINVNFAGFCTLYSKCDMFSFNF